MIKVGIVTSYVLELSPRDRQLVDTFALVVGKRVGLDYPHPK
jgi:hypothetical protein